MDRKEAHSQGTASKKIDNKIRKEDVDNYDCHELDHEKVNWLNTVPWYEIWNYECWYDSTMIWSLVSRRFGFWRIVNDFFLWGDVNSCRSTTCNVHRRHDPASIHENTTWVFRQSPNPASVHAEIPRGLSIGVSQSPNEGAERREAISDEQIGSTQDGKIVERQIRIQKHHVHLMERQLAI